MPTHYLGGIVCYKHIIHSHHSFNGFFHLLIVAVFGRFPYLLPCLCVSIFCFITLISCIWLPVCKLSSCYYIGHYINSYLFFVHSFHSILLPLEISWKYRGLAIGTLQLSILPCVNALTFHYGPTIISKCCNRNVATELYKTLDDHMLTFSSQLQRNAGSTIISRGVEKRNPLDYGTSIRIRVEGWDLQRKFGLLCRKTHWFCSTIVIQSNMYHYPKMFNFEPYFISL
jgi:hypothetical protein